MLRVQSLAFQAMRSRDARDIAEAIVGTQAPEGRVIRVTRIEQDRTAPFETEIVYEVDSDQAGDLTMPQTVRGATLVQMARRALRDGFEFTVQGYGQVRTTEEVVAEYNALIARANAGELR